jgi:hypothetical protein
VPSAVPVLIAVVIALALASLVSYIALRFLGRHSGPTLVFGLFMLAITFGLVAIFTLTFLRKTTVG